MVRALNQRLFKEAKRYIVGGVNSPVRSFKAVGGYPVFVKEGKGSKIYSEDNREFIDYCQSYGALILGHAHPEVVKELQNIITQGSSFGMPTKLETELAKIITEAIPSVEKVRLTNSGTEAVMGAVRLARAFTRKNRIIKFQGSYHGHADYLLNCPGIPKDFLKYTITLPYNKIKKIKELTQRYQRDIAAIIVEPVAGNMGVVLPKPGFLQELRKITHKYNIVLIFDEVITGFRLTFGGAQDLFGIRPDITCLGKIIGGGLPIGAFGGREEIMELLAPEGKVIQAGTFSGNPLSVSAGLATLKILSNGNLYRDLKKLTRYLCEKIEQLAGEYKIKLKINFIGSMFSIFSDPDLFKKLYHGLLKEGIYFSPSGFEANFLSTAHTKQDLAQTLKAIDKIFRRL